MDEISKLDNDNPGAGHFTEILERFYLPLTIAIVSAPTIMFGAHGGFLDNDTGRRLGFIVGLGFFLTVGCRLLSEKRGWTTWRFLVLSATAIALLAALVFAAPPVKVSFSNLTFTTVGSTVLLLLLAAPFVGTDYSEDDLANHGLAMFRSIAFSFCITLLLGLGLLTMLGATIALLSSEIEDSGMILAAAAATLCFVYLPVQFLMGLPRRNGVAAPATITGLLAVIVNRVVAPLATAFVALIPVMLIVLPFQNGRAIDDIALTSSILGVGGVAAWLISHHTSETDSRLARLFRKHFHLALLPLALLSGAATWSGIRGGGVTEQRYMLMLLAFWFGGVALYHILPTRRRLITAPISLAILLAASMFGPWGAVEVSARSQLARLANILSENNLLVSGGIKPASDDVDADTMKQISSVADYFYGSSRQEMLKAWFAEHGLPGASRFREGLLNEMNIRYVRPHSEFPEFDFLSLSRNAWKAGNSQYLIEIDDYGGHKMLRPSVEPEAKIIFGGQEGAPQAVFDREKRTITVIGDESESISFDLTPVIRDLSRNWSHSSSKDQEPITAEAQSPSGRLRAVLFITSIDGEIWQDDIALRYIRAMILVTNNTAPQ